MDISTNVLTLGTSYTDVAGTTGPSATTSNYIVNTKNDPPTAVNDTATLAEDSGLSSTNVISNDTDNSGVIADNDTLTLTAVSIDSASKGTVAINADGVSVDYTPANNFAGSTTITYTVSDGSLTDNDGELVVTVTGVNDTPTDITLSNSSLLENSIVGSTVGTLSTTDIDTSYEGDTFTYAVTGGSGQ